MKPSLDRTLKQLWLIIGIVLLFFLAAGGVMVAAQLIGNLGAGGDAVRVSGSSRPAREEPRAVRYGEPDAIRGTATRIVMVSNGAGYGQGQGEPYFSSSSGGRSPGAGTNVMFVDAAGVRLLLDRAAFIREVHYPSPRNEPAGQARPWIAYEMALDDANRDGRLDERDPVGLYVTDLEGRNLRPVLVPPLRYRSHATLDATRILVYALQPPAGATVDEDRMRQRAFLYDTQANRLAPYAAMDSAAERAGRILQR